MNTYDLMTFFTSMTTTFYNWIKIFEMSKLPKSKSATRQHSNDGFFSDIFTKQLRNLDTVVNIYTADLKSYGWQL